MEALVEVVSHGRSGVRIVSGEGALGCRRQEGIGAGLPKVVFGGEVPLHGGERDAVLAGEPAKGEATGATRRQRPQRRAHDGSRVTTGPSPVGGLPRGRRAPGLASVVVTVAIAGILGRMAV
jgi:hypothetical protein